MSSRNINVLGELNRLIEEDALSERSIETLTGIRGAALHALLVEEREGARLVGADAPTLTSDENVRLSMLAAQLTDGLTVADDDRLKSILESLISQTHLTVQNIAQLTGLRVQDLEQVLDDPQVVSEAKKYAIAIRCSYLVNTANFARRR